MDGRSGAVVVVQRFGGALNLNVHFYALVLDGVFARNGATVRFHPCAPLDAADVEEVLATVTAYVGKLLAHGGSGDGDDGGMLDEWADEAPALAGLAAASVQGRVALGARAGARVRRRGDARAGATDPSGLGPCHARHNGFDLHAGLCAPADQRDRLDRICRYALRPPVAQDRLQRTADGQVRLELRRPWADGTPTYCSTRSSSWSGSRRRHRSLASTSFSTTASWRRARRGGLSWPNSGPAPAPRRKRLMATSTRRTVATHATISGRS